MREEKQPKTPLALARARHLAERSATDLKLAHDAALACGLPFASLSKIKRAQREMRALLSDLNSQPAPAASTRRVRP